MSLGPVSPYGLIWGSILRGNTTEATPSSPHPVRGASLPMAPLLVHPLSAPLCQAPALQRRPSRLVMNDCSVGRCPVPSVPHSVLVCLYLCGLSAPCFIQRAVTPDTSMYFTDLLPVFGQWEPIHGDF